jgi:hypothetical protein
VVPFVYWLEYFRTRLDFLKHPRSGHIVLRVHPTARGAISSRPTPEIFARVPSLAGLVLTPAEVLGEELYADQAKPITFVATGVTETPNASVHVE